MGRVSSSILLRKAIMGVGAECLRRCVNNAPRERERERELLRHLNALLAHRTKISDTIRRERRRRSQAFYELLNSLVLTLEISK